MPSPRSSVPQSLQPSCVDEITPFVAANNSADRDYTTITLCSSPRPLASDSASSSKTDSRAALSDGPIVPLQTNSEAYRQGQEQGKRPGLWKSLEKYGAVELDNKGSVARDHLALERTFLAWLRTSLSFASIGIAITQLFRLNTTIIDDSGSTPSIGTSGTQKIRAMGKPLGATFLGISILVLLLGWRRYFESQYWIIKGKFPASRGSIVLVTTITGALIVTSMAVVLAVGGKQFEKRGEL